MPNENPKALRAGHGAAVQYEITVRLAQQRHPALRAPRWHARPAAAATLDARGLKRRVEDAHAFLMLLSRRARARPCLLPRYHASLVTLALALARRWGRKCATG